MRVNYIVYRAGDSSGLERAFVCTSREEAYKLMGKLASSPNFRLDSFALIQTTYTASKLSVRALSFHWNVILRKYGKR